ncbi:transport permease protein [Kitasatospora herbaricolor]|uniref:ABC transporter permease n=1 Tax=Kitasatospora herbaricolor TaxID=68217 RepID=UPI00174A4906|nr:ABC transporter permease [Kitasatospora herbaricolor]MDQ0309571.1 ABC-2 type transport system permease protein [Kitasatospora herbaricolor]GGV00954.1 transport permease protein [Kitasatospora herbaricolor]
MTTASTPATTRPAPTAPTTTPAGRILALGRAEATLLLRNRSALFIAVALPLLMIGALRGVLDQQAEKLAGLDLDAALVNGVVGFVLMFVVYYNLTSAYVARRNELVLKRLRTGEAGDLEILAGTAVPAVVLGLLMCALVAAGGAVMLHLPGPANPLLILAGLALALVLLIALAALSSTFTKTVESAGITTLPLMLVTQFGSGLLVPLEAMSDRVADLCRLLPATPAFELIRLGWFGTDGSGPATGFAGTWAEAAPHLAVGTLWTAVAVWATLRVFRWEPRR